MSNSARLHALNGSTCLWRPAALVPCPASSGHHRDGAAQRGSYSFSVGYNGSLELLDSVPNLRFSRLRFAQLWFNVQPVWSYGEPGWWMVQADGAMDEATGLPNFKVRCFWRY